MSVLKTFVSESFYENFNIIFMGNIKYCQKKISFKKKKRNLNQ